MATGILMSVIMLMNAIPLSLNTAPPTFSINTVVLIGVFLLISWIVRVIIYKDVTKRQEERNSNKSPEGEQEDSHEE